MLSYRVHTDPEPEMISCGPCPAKSPLVLGTYIQVVRSGGTEYRTVTEDFRRRELALSSFWRATEQSPSLA